MAEELFDEQSEKESHKRTTLSLSLTVSDKKALKMLAAKKGTTIAAIIHEWIHKFQKEIE